MTSGPTTPPNPYEPPNSYSAVSPAEPLRPRESGFGIASLVLSMVAGVGTFGLVVVAGVLAATSRRVADGSSQAVMLGLAMFGFVGLSGVGLAFAVAGLVHPHRSRISAVLGLIFNLLVALGFVGLLIIGVLASRG